ncbi:MAG: MBL-fold metallo-hydrolase superfamily [uncultured Sphingosinicella sp.]|uniref:MBL-fold metallo-hydrolase superfamily n=1 Tax=uncultured Sphingosinicella sp. TaxID=478748 RepID=A0A6J4U1B9_9SPHN|nr:MBL fold metallo-hydrolase [uncultured Sphingosinicella sp.]CAA9537743.1 MAG: MBL-fold metallo-hydrolase superfamily [uncultured Sphingosinicella sp.]
MDRSTPRGSSPREEEGSADQPYAHKGLTYPFGRRAPEAGERIEVAPGIGWARLPVPGSLKHVNVWLLDDGQDGAVVDTGLDIPPCREAWDTLLATALAGRRISRVIVTHFHPDHLGLAGWLTSRFASPLLMTREEWLFARMLTADVREAPPAEAVAYWRAAGWPEERIEAERAKGWGRFFAMVSPVPVSFVRIREGDVLRIGDRSWRIFTGNGHSPEHACLIDEAGGLMIAGDQVLPRITSNISLSLSEPEGDPLGDWLSSIAKLRTLPDTLLVLPSHGDPFTGLHARLDALDAGHRDRLDALHERLAEPQRAVDCFPVLFGRKIDDNSLGLATGEAMAHLRHLEVTGRAARDVRDGVHWFSQAGSA